MYRILGKYVKATHINDNYGNRDEHVLPFHGTVNWLQIMPIFQEIGYECDFTNEIHKEFNKLPDSLKNLLAIFSYEVAKYYLSLVT